jgi:hypothetical protein
MVDPELANTPTTKTLVVGTQNFNTFYDLVIKIMEDLSSNKEVFIYTIDTVRIFNPINFEPDYRYIVRYSTIDMDYWYNPQYVEQINNPIQPEQYFERYSNTRTDEKSNKPKSIGDSKLIHKF